MLAPLLEERARGGGGERREEPGVVMVAPLAASTATVEAAAMEREVALIEEERRSSGCTGALPFIITEPPGPLRTRDDEVVCPELLLLELEAPALGDAPAADARPAAAAAAPPPLVILEALPGATQRIQISSARELRAFRAAKELEGRGRTGPWVLSTLGEADSAYRE